MWISRFLILPATVFTINSYLLLITTIPTAFSDDADNTYLGSNCSGKSIQGNANYQVSRSNMLYNLTTNAPLNKGFRQASWAVGPRERVYGLALCRGDIIGDDCKYCLHKASIRVALNTCHDYSEGLIWNEGCFLKFSDQKFFRRVDTTHRFFKRDDYYGKDKWFKPMARDLLYRLIRDVDQNQKTARIPLFAYGNAGIGNETVNAMVQCTRDLSVLKCRTCLSRALVSILKLCLPKKGGRVFHGSCIMRYETYPFLRKFIQLM